MSYLVLDVETTISNNGNPFDKTNKLCMVGMLSQDEVIIEDIEFSVEPYRESLDRIQLAVDKCDVLVGFNISLIYTGLKDMVLPLIRKEYGTVS